MVRWTDCPAMTIAVGLGHKATKQTKLHNKILLQHKLNTEKGWPAKEIF